MRTIADADEPKMHDNDKCEFNFQHACLCPNSCENNDARQMRMIDQETRHKCTQGRLFHMPQNTGEEQLLLLAVPTLRQRKKNKSSSAVPGCTDTHCVLSYTSKGSSLDNTGSVKLNNVLKFVAAEMSIPVVDGSQSRAAHLPPNAPMASTTAGCDATWSLQLVARRDGEQPQAVTYHTSRVLMQ